MFNRKLFIENINLKKLTTAVEQLQEILTDDRYLAIKILDSKTNNTLLHDLAELMTLNEILSDTTSPHYDAAKMIMTIVMQHSNLASNQPSHKRTPFSQAVYLNHRAIAQTMFHFMKKNKFSTSLIYMLRQNDEEGNTALHHAVNGMNDVMIKLILEEDKNLMLFFARNNIEQLFSLALAMKNYKAKPTDLSLSILNQLYFSLPQGYARSRAVEEKVYLGHWYTSKPIWRYALYMCGTRDAKGKVISIDLNMLDLVKEVVDAGLSVLGTHVTMDLVFGVCDSYGNTPSDMLIQSYQQLDHGLAARTLNQATNNPTLARHREFMNRANLATANFHICQLTEDPTDPIHISHLNDNKSWIIIQNQKIFYLPRPLPGAERACQEIQYETLNDKRKPHFQGLTKVTDLTKKGRKATAEEIFSIMRIIPFIPQKNELLGKSTDLNLRTLHTKSKVSEVASGMTMFAKGGLYPANNQPPTLTKKSESAQTLKKQ